MPPPPHTHTTPSHTNIISLESPVSPRHEWACHRVAKWCGKRSSDVKQGRHKAINFRNWMHLKTSQ